MAKTEQELNGLRPGKIKEILDSRDEEFAARGAIDQVDILGINLVNDVIMITSGRRGFRIEQPYRRQRRRTDILGAIAANLSLNAELFRSVTQGQKRGPLR